MKRPQSYVEWLEHAGQENELGLKILLTSSLLRRLRKDAHKAMFAIMENAFEKALSDNGERPINLIVDYEKDLFMRAREVMVLIESVQGASLEEYSQTVFHHAENFYNQVKVWESKSLWQYIRWWFKRTFRKPSEN